MTTIESIQMNIHTCKTELRLGQKVICKNEIEKLHNQGLQEYFQIQLQELESCLKLAIKQKS
jgi:hypothetical protein